MLEQLSKATSDFFDRHWDLSELPPIWNPPWRFQGENHGQDAPGCYALIHGENVHYIGVATRHVEGRYAGSSLGARIANYWERVPGTPAGIYRPVSRWTDKIDGIIMIRLPESRWYLALALEGYLIAELRPSENVSGMKRTNQIPVDAPPAT